jgi:hypothetical protein
VNDFKDWDVNENECMFGTSDTDVCVCVCVSVINYHWCWVERTVESVTLRLMSNGKRNQILDSLFLNI